MTQQPHHQAPKITVEGTRLAGYWVNAGPGICRLGPIFNTPERAAQQLPYYRRIYGDPTAR